MYVTTIIVHGSRIHRLQVDVLVDMYICSLSCCGLVPTATVTKGAWAMGSLERELWIIFSVQKVFLSPTNLPWPLDFQMKTVDTYSDRNGAGEISVHDRGFKDNCLDV